MEEKVQSGILPLMVVTQQTKYKVRLVLNFKELNIHVAYYMGNDVCGETTQKWRQAMGATMIIDLKSVYLQLHVAEMLWQYQLVKYKGTTFCFNRLGFGMNVTPKIMVTVLKTVLKQEETIEKATNSHIDDILVDESVLQAEELRSHIEKHGLLAKPSESLDGGGGNTQGQVAEKYRNWRVGVPEE